MSFFYLIKNENKKIINLLLITLIIFSSLKFFNESQFIKFWDVPNLGENYFISTIFFMIIFSFLNSKNIKFEFKNKDSLFLIIISYFILIELFAVEKNFRYITDLSQVYLFYRFLEFIKLQNFHNNFLKIFSLIVFTFSTAYVFLNVLKKNEITFNFVDYGPAFYTYNEFFFISIFSFILLFSHFKNYKIILSYYFILIIFLIFIFSRSSLLIFLIVFPLLIFQLKISKKKKFFFALASIIITTLFLSEKINISIKSLKKISNDKEIIFDDNFSGERNSSIHRILNFERLLNELNDENIFFGRGYEKTIKVKKIIVKDIYPIEFGKCECSIFFSLFSYGIVGFVSVIFLFLVIISKSILFNLKKRNFNNLNFQISVLFTIISYGLFFPDIPAWYGYAIYVIENKKY